MDNFDSKAEAAALLAEFGEALVRSDIDAAAQLFADDGYWRDLVALTWNIKTMAGREAIRQMLSSCLPGAAPQGWELAGQEGIAPRDGIHESWITFETRQAWCSGLIRIRDGKIWTLLTTARALKGHEERQGHSRHAGLSQGVVKDRETWKDRLETERRTLGRSVQPYVVIVGGGQGGIALAARLRQLDIPALVLDRHERPGDAWRKRYSTLTLQDPVWYDHLPYLEFPKNWPIYSPKDKIADWLKAYSEIMELNYWGSTEVKHASYDEANGKWLVHAVREGEEIVFEPQHLVLATGMSGRPRTPAIPGMESFRGDQHHSSRHPGPHAYAGKRAVVIGSNNSAHDIAQALWEAGAEVTLVQRSSTLVVKQASLNQHALKRLYSEEAVARGLTVERADMLNASTPYALMGDVQRQTNEAIKAQDQRFYDDLAKVGFQVDWGEGGNTGVFSLYLSRGAGYYIDIGASDLVIDGSIALKSKVDVARIESESVVFSDGTEVAADLIVYATGYDPMEGWVLELLGPEIAAKVGKAWGLGSGLRGDPGPWEGELRNMWKPTRQQALWFHGGNLAQSRFYSHFLAIQLKARRERMETPVFG